MAALACPSCGETVGLDAAAFECACGDLFEVVHDFANPPERSSVERDATAMRGVWSFRSIVAPHLEPERIVTLGEGDTPLYDDARLRDYAGADLALKHEGMNPTGSFKDRGMTVAVSQARGTGAAWLVCASTGNTSASLAAFAARAGLRALVVVPEKATSLGKLSQALAYGARTLAVKGDFDAAMGVVRALGRDPQYALLNSANPFRLEGQKTIPLEIVREGDWDVPDWIVLPAGNLGNCAAFGKAFRELVELGWIQRVPRLAAVQAAGSAPFADAFDRDFEGLKSIAATTHASAIRIGNPVSYERAVRAIRETRGVVSRVSDDELFAAKALVDRLGLGAEPASCVSVAGAKQLVERGVIAPNERVVCVLTGHLLKDPDMTLRYHRAELSDVNARAANVPEVVEASVETVRRLLERDPEN